MVQIGNKGDSEMGNKGKKEKKVCPYVGVMTGLLVFCGHISLPNLAPQRVGKTQLHHGMSTRPPLTLFV